LETLTTVLNILKVALGLGFVIFIHELGHFLLAKWNGVKVEKFSIGFGPTLLGFRRGETEYVLAAVPLGGFVKMLGEGPEEEENKSTDPRAYPNKSVGARMAIISAGVIMNLITGYLFFVIQFSNERIERPARIGGVVAGSPAFEAGLRAGDEVVGIDGRAKVGFIDLTRRVSLSSRGQTLDFEIKRPDVEKTFHITIQPRREIGLERPTIGVLPSTSLVLYGFRPMAGMPDTPRYPWPDKETRKVTEDVLVAMTPDAGETISISDVEQLHQQLYLNRSRAIDFRFERRPIEGSKTDRPTEQVEFQLPPAQFVDFGFHLTMEPISSILKDSPADKAGFRLGDRIVAVDGSSEFNPMRLPDLCFDKAGQTMSIEVERAESGDPRKRITLSVTPSNAAPWTQPILGNQPLEIPGLGICYPIRPLVSAVEPDSPAARAGIKVGDVINAVALEPPASPPKTGDANAAEDTPDEIEAPPRSVEISLEDHETGWASLFWQLQRLPGSQFNFTVNHASKKIQIEPAPVPDWFNPMRGLVFRDLFRTLPPLDLAAAAQRGLDETVENVLGIYAMFRSLFQGRIGTKGLGGPLTIAQVAYDRAGSGLVELISFLGFLSINLAVLNFLPIPPLDGGQMVFLIAEKLRGKPLPTSALMALIYIGLPLLIGLMIFVTYQDIVRLVWGG
jgi:regulator of sigma E protease